MASRTGLVKRRVKNLKTNTSSEGDPEFSFSARKRKANVPAPKKRSPVKPALSKQNRSNSKKKRSAVLVKMANTKNTGTLTKSRKPPTASAKQRKISPDLVKKGKGPTTPARDCKTPAISRKGKSPTTPGKKGKNTLTPTMPTGKKNSAASTSKGKASSTYTSIAKTSAVSTIRKARTSAPSTSRAKASAVPAIIKARTSAPSTSRTKASAVPAIRKARTSAPSTSKAMTNTNRATKRKVTDTNNDRPTTTSKMTKKDDDSQRELRQTIVDMKNKILKDNRPKKHTVDVILKKRHPDAEIYEDYSCILSKIVKDKCYWYNTYFVIQITTDADRYVFFWRDNCSLDHRPGKHESKTFHNIEDAIKNFKKLFKTKTKNDWETREDFVIHERKYTPLDLDEEADELYSKIDIRDHIPYKEFSPSEKDCPLPYGTQALLARMLYEQTFHRVMSVLQPETDVWAERKLTKLQLLKGLEVLVDLDEAITKGEPHKVLEQLSKNFFSVLPFCPCECMEAADAVKRRIDTICLLTGIISGPYGAMKRVKVDIHPLQEIYQSLDCELVLLEDTAPEYQLFDEYAMDSPKPKLMELQSIWRVDCKAERERFKTYDNEPNHELLWYDDKGMWELLKNGVNEYGHSVYFKANCTPQYYDNYKDLEGLEDSEGVSIVFLVEVALGKEFDQFEHSIIGGPFEVPDGYDSLLVRGTFSTDPANDKIIVLDGKNVTIPAWKRVEDFEADKICSSILSYHLSNTLYFYHIIHGGARARLRYMLKFKDK